MIIGGRTAMEHALSEDRSTKRAKPGIAATLTPLSASAAVTLKLAGSKVVASAPAVKAPIETVVSLMVTECATTVYAERKSKSGTE